MVRALDGQAGRHTGRWASISPLITHFLLTPVMLMGAV